ncbi:MAG: sensor histidine kinase [Flavobacteriaceae bacterium]|nr:sensor histidine kinase [Flavobacteriaceae bacterium]
MLKSIIAVLFSLCMWAQAQDKTSRLEVPDSNFYKVLDAFRQIDIPRADSILSVTTFEDAWLNAFFTQQLQEFKTGENERYNEAVKRFETFPDSTPVAQYFKHVILGDLAFYEADNLDSLSFSHYLKANEIVTFQKNDTLKAEVLKRILRYLFKSERNRDVYENYLKEYQAYLYDDYEKLYALYYELGLQMARKFYDTPELETPISLSLEGISLSEKLRVTYLNARFCQLLGVNYDLFEKKPELGMNYYQKAIEKYLTLPYYFAQSNLFGMYTNQGVIYQEKEDFRSAMRYFRKALNIPLKIKNKDDLILVYNYMYVNQKAQQRMDSAVYYLELKNKIQEVLNLEKSVLAINDIQTKYETEKKERENLELKNANQVLETQRAFNRNISIAALVSLFGLAVIAVLGYKNMRKKQALVEKEKQLERQRTASLLQQQEINIIDAMIQGQEAERQHLANELHDNLGGLLATLKLNFEQIGREKSNEKLMLHTESLMDEAYKQVRLLAHSKNAGVLANRGLLKAIKKLASDVSASQKLTVEVEAFGLENRLENSLEILLFRIVQELVTNIIKHADARRVTIYLTQHSDHLNLMVEDDGKGFDTHRTKLKDGMGLLGIEQRIQQIDGTLEIESIENKGTSVIINIPYHD